jgi:GT2 family glycosyltransferase
MDDMTDSPRVTTIILNWNGIRDTLECLASVRNLDYPEVRIVVVDNGSTDGSPAVIRQKYPSVVLLENGENLGFTGGNNLGMRKALEMGTDYLWLLNNDTILERDTLRNLLGPLITSPEAGLASPVIHYHEKPEAVQFRGSYIDWERKRIVKLEEGDPVPDPTDGKPVSLWGTALLIKRAVVECVGYLNEKYFAYHEDEEYCMRAARAGYRCVVVPEARIFHKNSRSTGSNDAPMQVFLRSRNLYFLWMDSLKGMERALHVRRYLAQIISHGGSLREKNLPESVDACLDGVWHALRGAGGARNPEIRMPAPVRGLFRFLFSWHPFLWASLLSGDFRAIASNVRRRIETKQQASGRP